ncbi:17631_t:CDS:2, partial [Funneliformis geosporum]
TSKFGIEHISAFPLQGYHTKKKPYIRVTTWNHFDRYKALKIVREVGISTASDDLNPTYYYRKVACEKRLPLSSWAVLSNYSYKYKGNLSANLPTLSRDRTLVLTWDIEIYSSQKTGEVPNAKYEEDVVFMICMTVHWKNDPEPLKQICLVDVETAPDLRLITVVCENQTNLLKAFALCWKCLAPDIHLGFNDSQYDWPFIVEKAKKLDVLKWMFNHMLLKPMSLEKITKWQYQYNMIKKFYPKAEKSSLAYYLRECNLDNKVDLPIHRMNKYYERALKETNATMAEQMCKIAKYCIIDALSCQQLMIKHNVINEYREVASIAFISLFDTHYFAIEMKGLKNKRPVTSLDFASLYPSLIMTYNLSPDKIILSRKHAESLRGSEHNNIPEEKGLYAKILEYLSSKWNEIKKRLAPLKERKEDMELVIGLMNKEYDSVCFDYSCFDAKQNALKVYMNTFYGTAGDSKSSFFLCELAEGVTSAGQRNIKLVADFIKNKGFGIKYGDTDFLYLVCPKECFQECDEAYYNGNGISKEEYWSRIVQISMEEIGILRDEVNTFLREDNGSSYLKMAYKEVLFLVVFTGKKKYYGIPHESKPNFNKELFIRGVEIVDNSHTLHQIIKDILRETVKDISQTDLNEIIKTAIHTCKEADAKQLIKKDLTPEPYLYQIPEPGKRFEYVVVENNSSERMGNKMEYPEVARRLGKKINISYYLKSVVNLCARFINYDELFQPSSEIMLEALKKLKDGNKA